MGVASGENHASPSRKEDEVEVALGENRAPPK